MSEYSLRPHHGLCIAFFIGKGYNSDFTKNMASIIEQLKLNNPQIILVSEADIICRYCPNLKNGLCTGNEKVLSFDNAVMNFCGLEYRQSISWNKLSKLINENIIKSGCRRLICGSCQWDQLCNQIAYTGHINTSSK